MKIYQRKDCPYFPCTFPEQSCKHCYCPLYPCKILKTGGIWIETKTGHKLWDCSNCKVIHMQEVVELLDLDKNETNDEILKIAKEKLIKYLNKDIPVLHLAESIDSRILDIEFVKNIDKGKYIKK